MGKYLNEIEIKMKQIDFLRREDVETIIVRINNTTNQKKVSSANLLRDQAVKKVNMALELGDSDSLVQALKVSYKIYIIYITILNSTYVYLSVCLCMCFCPCDQKLGPIPAV